MLLMGLMIGKLREGEAELACDGYSPYSMYICALYELSNVFLRQYF